MRRYAAYLFDLDGVIYRGKTPLPGAVEAVNTLARSSKIAFLTNNSALHRSEFVQRLTMMGIRANAGWKPALQKQSDPCNAGFQPALEVFTSGYVAACRLEERGYRRVFVVGESGLVDELREKGLEVVKGPPCDAVIVGRDTGFTFEKLVLANRAIRDGAAFFASNRDVTYPVEDGLEPGAGAIVAAVAASVEREPESFGKPSPAMARFVLEALGVTASDALLVGDRLDTDIECARRAGIDSALVLTGVTTAEHAQDGPAATSVIETLNELVT